MKQALIYCLKVWFTTAFLTPIILCIATALYDPSGAKEPTLDYILFVLACILFALVYSIIPFLVLWYVTYRLTFKLWTHTKYKVVLIVIAEMITTPLYIGFDIAKGNLDWYTLYICLPYSIVVAGSIWFYKLKPSSTAASKETFYEPNT